MRQLRVYRHLSVSGKLQLIGLVSLVFSIVLSTAWLLVNDYRMSNALVRQAIETEARIVADNVAVPLHFDDQEAAAETLAALRASPAVTRAQLLLPGGRLFAEYHSETHAATSDSHSRIDAPVRLKARALGVLRIDYDVSSFAAQWLQKAAVAVAVALLAILGAFFMMRRLLCDIVAPISQLSSLMEKVALSQDYSLRAQVLRDDELGQLARRLDEMLTTIGAYREAELRRAEQQLSQSEERYNKLVESVPVGVVQFDETGRLVFANRMFRQMVGEAEHGTLDFVHPHSRREAGRMLEAVLDGCHEHALEVRLNDRDDAEVWVSVEASPLYVSDGRAGGAVATLLDVTERRQRDADLRLAASVFEASHEAIVITDAQGLIISTNRAFSRITEYSANEVLGRKPSLLSAGSTPPEVYIEMWQQLCQAGVWNGELLNRRKSGATYPSWVSIATVSDTAGQTCNYISLSRDITGIKEENQRIQHLAHYDGLTGLPNRTLFYDRARVALARAQRDGLGFAVLFVDLDRFKWVNDTLGHAVGDALLREVARRLEAGVRASDTVSRFGGDEFVLLLSAVQAEEAAAIANKLLTEVGGEALCGGHVLHITPSIGLSLWSLQTQDLDSLIREADEAMYLAKRGGRNQVCIYRDGVQA